MNEVEKLTILREQITALRSEVVRYSDSQRTIARYAVVGVAAIAALRKDLSISDFEAFLPIVPILAMGLIAILVLENVFIFRSGRWLAAAEQQLNAIAGEEFLRYEQSIHTWRRKWLAHGLVAAAILVVATVGYFGSIIYLFTFSDLALHPGIALVIWIFAIIAYLFAALYFIRMIGELRAGVPTLHPAQPLGPALSTSGALTSATTPAQPPPPVQSSPQPTTAPAVGPTQQLPRKK